MDELPLDIDDTEKLIRAIICPFHLKRGTLKVKSAAFKSAPGTDDVSVMRHSYLGSNVCKQKAKAIGAASPGDYIGLAVLTAAAIREAGSTVHDSRKEYMGHAHISHGFVAVAHEPYPPQISRAIDALLAKTKYHPDPDPESDYWAGATL